MTNEEIAKQLEGYLKRYKESPVDSRQRLGALRGINASMIQGLRALGVNPYKTDLSERDLDYGNEHFEDGVEKLIADLKGK